MELNIEKTLVLSPRGPSCLSSILFRAGRRQHRVRPEQWQSPREQNERAKRNFTKEELPPTATSTYVEANVLMNVTADEYVAVFGVAQEAESVAECNRKMDATIKQFTDELKTIGIAENARFVDFIAQNKIYGFEVTGEIAREKLVGFELKKNVSIHYKDKSLIDKLVVAASRAEIFDLVKVDYVVSQRDAIDDKLMEEASRIIKRKASRYEKLLDIKLQPPGQIIAETTSVYHPTEMYDSYAAFESEHVNVPANRDRLTTQTAQEPHVLLQLPDCRWIRRRSQPGDDRARRAVHALSQGEVRGEADWNALGRKG